MTFDISHNIILYKILPYLDRKEGALLIKSKAFSNAPTLSELMELWNFAPKRKTPKGWYTEFTNYSDMLCEHCGIARKYCGTYRSHYCKSCISFVNNPCFKCASGEQCTHLQKKYECLLSELNRRSLA